MKLHGKKHHRFSLGAALPLITATLAPAASLLWLVPTLAICLLATLGGTAAAAGGAPPLRGAVRVCFSGSLAMGLTALVGKFFEVAV